MDKYLCLQLIGVAPLFSPSALLLEAFGLSWLLEGVLTDRVREDEEDNR